MTASMAHVLVADDDRDLAEAVGWYLTAEGMEVTVVHDGRAALASFEAEPTDALVLDIMMPGIDGFELCRRLRQITDAPILMLSAREGEADKVRALTLGADDYVTKPFGTMELVARVKALLRRAGSATPGPMKSAGLSLCPVTRVASVCDRPLNLTRLEFDLLAALMRHAPGVLSRARLVSLAWGEDFYGDVRLVDSHIYHLREKLAAAGLEPVPIVTIRGVGYAFSAKA
jgi:DNA-binding response OmpR family regulator